MKTIEIPSLEALSEAARRFTAIMDDRTVFAFRGEMGSGKTTFIAALCRELGAEDTANSPSFSIINEYRSTLTDELIYHFDFYRLKDEREALEIGTPDYFDSGALCFAEWPEKVENLLPGDVRYVDVIVNPDGSRTLRIDD